MGKLPAFSKAQHVLYKLKKPWKSSLNNAKSMDSRLHYVVVGQGTPRCAEKWDTLGLAWVLGSKGWGKPYLNRKG